MSWHEENFTYILFFLSIHSSQGDNATKFVTRRKGERNVFSKKKQEQDRERQMFGIEVAFK